VILDALLDDLTAGALPGLFRGVAGSLDAIGSIPG